jgi:alpha-tubulin suppressor-like RCC1 family protein
MTWFQYSSPESSYHNEEQVEISRGKGIRVIRLPGSIQIQILGFEPLSVGREDFIHASCGTLHALLLTTTGDLYAIGSNRNGQCGHSTILDDVMVPFRISSGVKKAVAGGSSSFFINESGTLYSMGSNKYGQLGINPQIHGERTTIPIRVPLEFPVSDISAGPAHTCILTGGVVYGCGLNSNGQLNFCTTSSKLEDRFQRCVPEFESPVMQVSCGTWCTGFLTVDGDIYFCGRPPILHIEPESLSEILRKQRARVARWDGWEPAIAGMRKLACESKFSSVHVGSSIALGLSADRTVLQVIDLFELEIIHSESRSHPITFVTISGIEYSYR